MSFIDSIHLGRNFQCIVCSVNVASLSFASPINLSRSKVLHEIGIVYDFAKGLATSKNVRSYGCEIVFFWTPFSPSK